jgi:putative ATPase
MLQPLAFRVRPEKISDIIGQKELVGENGFLTNSVKEKLPISFILYGTPGTGKTTIAECYSKSLGIYFMVLNAVTSNKKQMEEAINEAKKHEAAILIIDEIHRLNKDKQDILLPYVEDGTIYLIGTTTANPYISINKAIRSRCHLLEVKPLNEDEIVYGLKKAIENPRGYSGKFKIDDDSLNFVAKNSNGDFRFALNFLEVLHLTYKDQDVNLEMTRKIVKVPNYAMDKDDDEHYDAVSALQKSIRGSDVDAALYYAARLCIVEDLESLERRLLVTAYEDVGIANPQACMRCKIAIEAAEQVGLPEAIIPLSVAIVDLCLSPKSKSADLAMGRAMALAQEKPLHVLDYLKLTPVNVKDEWKYPYDMPELWSHLQYLPNLIKDEEIFKPNLETTSSYERVINENYLKLKKEMRSSDLPSLKKKYSKKF